MSTTNDLNKQMKESIDETDDDTAKKILESLEIKQTSVWWHNEPTEDAWLETNEAITTNEKQLSYEQVKQLYPHWFKE